MQPAGVRNWKCVTTLFGDQSTKTSNLTRNGSIEDVPGEDVSLLDNIPVEQKRTTKRHLRHLQQMLDADTHPSATAATTSPTSSAATVGGVGGGGGGGGGVALTGSNITTKLCNKSGFTDATDTGKWNEDETSGWTVAADDRAADLGWTDQEDLNDSRCRLCAFPDDNTSDDNLSMLSSNNTPRKAFSAFQSYSQEDYFKSNGNDGRAPEKGALQHTHEPAANSSTGDLIDLDFDDYSSGAISSDIKQRLLWPGH